MSCRSVSHGQQVYRFCPDDSLVAGDRVRGLVVIRVVDEITHLPPETDLTASTRHRRLAPRVSAGGIVGVGGNPMRLFPQLGVRREDIELSIAAHRYITRHILRPLGPIDNFPDEFTLPPMTNEFLHREAVSFRGRVVKAEGDKRVPLPNVIVSIAGIWRTFPGAEVDAESVMEQPNLVCLTPGFYAEHTENASTLRKCETVLSSGAEKTLATPAPRRTTQIALSDRTGLGVDDLLAIEPDHPDLAEFIKIRQVDELFSEDLPAIVTLAHPLANDHFKGAHAVRAELAEQGPAYVLTRDAIPGDRVAFLNAMAGLDGAWTVELSGAGQSEYHMVQCYKAQTNDDGYFRLPPISRVAQLRLGVSGIPVPDPNKWAVSPDYRYPENQFDLVFP